MSGIPYRSRVVIADVGGLTRVFGPVHTEKSLHKLIGDLTAGGWHVQRHVTLTSLAQFKEEPHAWQALQRHMREVQETGVEP